AGGNSINGPYFSIDDDAALKVEARKRALASARAQAQFYAGQTGYGSARLVSITESQGYSGGPMPVAMVTRDVAESAKAPVEPGQVSTAISMTVQYRLER
ncbi:MAG: SIMPL domain-containing protein, partial [Sphingomonadales bacterium]|nr:SIMPL domain-containing protein [Sphingomonadales bacterium]